MEVMGKRIDNEYQNLLISVVIPCYNVEKYVGKCIDSIMNQTYKFLDVIVIDDDSNDKTYEILEILYKKYEGKFRLFKNEKNKGLAGTRNFGVLQAKGKYVGFIDSDDYVDSFYYQELVDSLIKSKSDLVVNDICTVKEDGGIINRVKAFSNNKLSKIDIIDNGLAASACNKLLRKDLLIKYPFLEGRINEDVASIIPVIIHSNKVTYNEKSIYYYVQRNGSIQNSEFSNRRFDIFESVNVCLERIQDDKNYEIYRDYILLHQIIEIYIYILIEIENQIKRKELISLFLKKIEEYDFNLFKIHCLNDFIKLHRKRDRFYYWYLIKILKYRNVNKINRVIKLKKHINKYIENFYKLSGRNKENGRYTLQELIRLAKKQSRLKNENIKISVVVPNYNYEEYLIRRIYSILAQKTKIFELIILDDCSKDNSRELIDKIVDCISPFVGVRKIYNDVNSGGAFFQWSKGVIESKGDYVWIAEADDYCDKKLLKKLLEPIKKDINVYLSYSDTAFTEKNGTIFIKTIKPEIDVMKTGHWDKDFINNGIDEIKQYSFLNNTIANVSSCIIKNGDYSEVYKDAVKYRQAGDWIFYLNIISKGKIAYVDKALNYYRVHDTQITTNMDKRKHLEEIKNVYKYIDNKFGTNEFQKIKRKERIEFLKNSWNIE